MHSHGQLRTERDGDPQRGVETQTEGWRHTERYGDTQRGMETQREDVRNLLSCRKR